MLTFGFCHLSAIPVRETPSDRSQMTTQLLFGDVFEVFDKKGNWLNIRNAYDHYSGWIDAKQQITIDSKIFDAFKSPLFTNTISGELKLNGEPYSLVPASSFPSDQEFFIGNHHFELSFKLHSCKNKQAAAIPSMALSYLNAPYLWGGKTPYGIDCSGFSQNVYKTAGIRLKRDASEQAGQGETLSFLSETKPGDLVFFDNDEGLIIHVGILLSPNKIIHASGKVRIDAIDHQGIFNEETRSYTHNLRLIKTHQY